jgi:hypothetical protein
MLALRRSAGLSRRTIPTLERCTVRRHLVLAGSLLALAVPLPLAAAQASSTPGAPIAHIACTQARIAGQSKCIARGQFCAHNARAMKDYARYGLHCNKRDGRGNWHLT